MELKIREILDATKGRLVRGNPDTIIEEISTDSRTLQKEVLFVALSGEKFDGHDFLAQVAEKGGIGAIVSRPVMCASRGEKIQPQRRAREASSKSSFFLAKRTLQILIEVDDTLRAYGDIANTYRKKFDIPIIAITGSNGKTTTKNMTTSILSQRFYVLSPEKSFNNQIGVPATLLKLEDRHEVAVLEFGTNMPGEIKRLTQIAQPNIGVITNVGATHLEKLGSIKSVAEEKGDLLKGVEIAVLNADDDNFDLLARKANGKIVTFGMLPQRAKGQKGKKVKRQEGKEARRQRSKKAKGQIPESQKVRKRENKKTERTILNTQHSSLITHHASRNTQHATRNQENPQSKVDITASDISLTDDGRSKFNLILDGVTACEVRLPCLGEYNVYNALAATSVGKIMKLDYAEIKAGLEEYKPAEMRMQKTDRNGITIVNDAYNSNPHSLPLALEFFSKLDCQGKKIAVLADMLELGESSAKFHRQIGKKMPPSIDVLITVGDHAKIIAEGSKKIVPTVYSLQSNLDARKLLDEIVTEGDAVLLKGSRGMKLEEVLEEI